MLSEVGLRLGSRAATTPKKVKPRGGLTPRGEDSYDPPLVLSSETPGKKTTKMLKKDHQA